MSYSPAQMYPSAYEADANYLGGKYKDSSAPGVYDGTPLNTLLFNQNLAFHDAMMVEAGLTYNNTADIPATSQLHKAMQQTRQVAPLNNSWNGYFTIDHLTPLPSPVGLPLTSGAGGTVYDADDEFTLDNYSSASSNTISLDADGLIFSQGIYKLFTYTVEQLALIDVEKVPVYIVGDDGSRHFVKHNGTSVVVTKPDTTTLKVQINNAILAELGITKVFGFFVTDGVGFVPALSPEEVEYSIRGFLLVPGIGDDYAEVYKDGRVVNYGVSTASTIGVNVNYTVDISSVQHVSLFRQTDTGTAACYLTGIPYTTYLNIRGWVNAGTDKVLGTILWKVEGRL